MDALPQNEASRPEDDEAMSNLQYNVTHLQNEEADLRLRLRPVAATARQTTKKEPLTRLPEG